MFRGWESAVRKPKKRHGETRHRPWPLSERPGFLIRRLHQIHVALFQEACGEFEVTPLQYSLLSALAARKTADQTTLAADIALDRTTTTGALKRLAARNFVERAVDDEDRRARVRALFGDERRVRFRGRGFTQAAPVYAHYLFGGRERTPPHLLGRDLALARLLGKAKAIELMATGRLMSFGDAHALGLVNEVWGEAELKGRSFRDAVRDYAQQFTPPPAPEPPAPGEPGASRNGRMPLARRAASGRSSASTLRSVPFAELQTMRFTATLSRAPGVSESAFFRCANDFSNSAMADALFIVRFSKATRCTPSKAQETFSIHRALS